MGGVRYIIQYNERHAFLKANEKRLQNEQIVSFLISAFFYQKFLSYHPLNCDHISVQMLYKNSAYMAIGYRISVAIPISGLIIIHEYRR